MRCAEKVAAAYRMGHRDALDAAREAVWGVNWFNDEGKMLSAIVATAESIAAIEALRGEEMTEHLPECPVEKRLRSGKTVSSQTCICGALRACEERVIDAAQEAVAALTKWPDSVEPDNLSFLNYCHGIRDARSAIDALREGDQP